MLINFRDRRPSIYGVDRRQKGPKIVEETMVTQSKTLPERMSLETGFLLVVMRRTITTITKKVVE